MNECLYTAISVAFCSSGIRIFHSLKTYLKSSMYSKDFVIEYFFARRKFSRQIGVSSSLNTFEKIQFHFAQHILLTRQENFNAKTFSRIL